MARTKPTARKQKPTHDLMYREVQEAYTAAERATNTHTERNESKKRKAQHPMLCESASQTAAYPPEKVTCNEGDRTALRGVFDALNQYHVLPAKESSHARCHAFAHSDGLTLEFDVVRNPAKENTIFEVSHCTGQEGWHEIIDEAYDLNLTNENQLMSMIQTNFGTLNSQHLASLNDPTVQKRLVLTAGGHGTRCKSGQPKDGAVYLMGFTDAYKVHFSFLSAIGPVHMEGTIPVWASYKKIMKAVSEGQTKLTLTDMHVNWEKFYFDAGDEW